MAGTPSLFPSTTTQETEIMFIIPKCVRWNNDFTTVLYIGGDAIFWFEGHHEILPGHLYKIIYEPGVHKKVISIEEIT